MVGKPNQADRVVEFIDPKSDAAKKIDKEYWVLKETERPKYSATQIVKMMQKEGFRKFKVHHHTLLWQSKDGKKPGKGYGAQLGVQFWWYDRWIDVVRKHCQENPAKYGADAEIAA